MKKLTTTIGLLTCIASFAQQDPQFTNFEQQKYFFNPASLIQTNYICGQLIGRNQWNSFNGNPNTAFLGIQYTPNNKNYFGIQFLKDNIAMQNSNFLKLSYAHKLILNNAQISLGGSANVLQTKWQSNFITPDTPQWQDDAIPDVSYNKTKMDFDAGIFVKSNELYMGISATQLSEADFSKNGVISYKSKRHYYVMAGYEKRFNWGSLEPKILAKSDVASTQLDFQVQAWYNYNILLGFNYRISDAISPMIGIKYGILTAIYSYDITTSRIKNYSKGSHEITLSFCLTKPKFIERHTDPRHLGNYDFGPRGKW